MFTPSIILSHVVKLKSALPPPKYKLPPKYKGCFDFVCCSFWGVLLLFGVGFFGKKIVLAYKQN